MRPRIQLRVAASAVLFLVFVGFDGSYPIGAADTIAQWRFEENDRAEIVGRLETSTEVPGPFVYDPLTRQSAANARSALCRKGDAALRATPDLSPAKSAASLTIEAFVKPGADAGGDALLVGKTRASGDASELGLAWIHLQNDRQTWHGGMFSAPGSKPERFTAGHYSSTTRLDRRDPRWRHIAVVYDAETKIVTVWVDYHLSQSRTVAQPLVWDDAPLVFGGFDGRLDEVRIVCRAIGPAQFLRARADEIRDVEFSSTQQVLPRGSGALDVKEHFGAAGDGRTDDTAAFQAAFDHLCSKVPLAYNTLIIPLGTYLLSDTVQGGRFIDVKGAGPQQTILQLKDNVFTDPTQPRPVLRMSSSRSPPGSHKSVNGSSISIYVDGLTIDTGRNNPGAKAIEFHANNLGRLENCVLRSGDGVGVCGLDLTHHDVGPALVKHVRVEGFDYGAAIRYQEYSMTLEHVTLSGQRIAGIRNQGNILAIRGLRSTNRVPAVVAEGGNSMVTLLDSNLDGGSPECAAVQADGGLYCLRVQTAGYGSAVEKRILVNQKPAEWKTETIVGPRIDEYVSDKFTAGFGDPRGALQLPIEETPEPPVPPISEWVNVRSFASAKRGDDWGPAVQAAIDGGARVVYFPRGERYRISQPVRLHGRIERLVGLNNELQTFDPIDKRREQQNAAAPKPVVIVDENDPARTIVFDRLNIAALQHTGAATLVLRSSTPGRFTSAPGAGKLFLEDVGGADYHFDHPQRVWVRQWNPESHAAGPCIHSRGATIWALGFKTEYESSKLWAEAGAQTEILGAFIYPIGKVPPDRPIFKNTDSRMSVVYGTSVYAANHKLHIVDRRGDETKQYGNDALKWSGSRGRMDLFTSDGGANSK